VKLRALIVPAIALSLTACKVKQQPTEALTSAEAQQALEEASVSTEASNVMSGSIDIATSFTIGQAVEAAAAEIRDFVTTQLPCAQITLSGATLSIEYGVNEGNCTYKGLTYTGTHTITVSKNDESDVLVEHTWDELSNGRVSVTGTADVTWSFDDQTRHVVHELEWTRLKDGRTGVGSGDRTQQPLEGGLAVGFQEDGSRTWEGQAGRWDLAIQGVQMRWIDPVPQAGKFILATPKNKSVEMAFTRVDEDTIQVTVSSGGHSFQFNVSKLGISG
jgi:hypothetical protein